jgi:sialate O-acetylesterase
MTTSACLALLCLGDATARAEVIPSSLFADHAVLQQGMPIPVWGTAAAGEAVTVEMAGQKLSTTANRDGAWRVQLAPVRAGGPFTLTIAGRNTVVLSDVLVGEVWLCGGQSNMERQLGPRVGQQPITDWEKEAAAATYPQIRHFGVAQTKSFTPRDVAQGRWEVCSPESVKDFTAVGYFFGRDLHRARHVPVGLIHSSWGGTPAEAWTSLAGLRALPVFATLPEQLRELVADPAAARRRHESALEIWFRAHDAGSIATPAWSAPTLDPGGWKAMPVPALWEDEGEPDLNGVVWYRKTFDLPAGVEAAAADLRLGMVDDVDTTWVNGAKVGFTAGYNLVRSYPLPAGLLKPGRNVIAVRVLDTGGGGGIWGEDGPRIVFADKAAPPPVALTSPWQYRVGRRLEHGPWPPAGFTGDPTTPTVLWNGMIAPLVPYAMRGAIWYQGEANVQRETEYRAIFPALIADWRRAWGQGDFPFLFVQIAPFRDMTPELRDAQLATWLATPNTAMVVTTDCGDANDIHPARKQPVGARLALAARALAYGEPLEYSGPVFESMTVAGSQAILRFTHLGGGLVAKGGTPRGFTVAGSDRVFHPGVAVIRGATVRVSSRAVPKPAAVRYGWANVPDGNLFNQAGLPASPFRTDEN